MGDTRVFQGTERYEVIESLGTGGMGAVFAVLDRSTNTRVALKLLHQHDPQSLELFKREFRNIQDIQHRNLISLGELREDAGQWFFTMELLSGENFQRFVRAGAHAVVQNVQRSPTFLARGASLPSQLFSGMSKRVSSSEIPRSSRRRFHEGRLRDAMAQLACGLAVLHRAHKVHADIKPSNILVEADGRVVLLDFGIAVDLDQHQQTRTDKVIGTVQYMAPEQIDPAATGPASDCYAVGVLMYEALTGSRPFAGQTPRELLETKRHKLPQPPSRLAPGIPEDLEGLCMDLLSIERENRPTAEDILRRLGAWDLLTQLPESEQPASDQDIFVGRQNELNQLLDASRPPIRGHIMVVTGPSGVGKTSLMSRFHGMLSNTLVLSGRCYERESVPFKGIDGVIEGVLDYLRQCDARELEELIPDGITHIARVFPGFGLLFDSKYDIENTASSPFQLRREAFSRLRTLFTRLARRTPIVISLDDMQLADAEAWSLIEYLMREPHPPPLLVVLFMRPTESIERAQISRLENVEFMRLAPLAPSESRTLAVRLLSSQGRENDELANEIAGESEGHPLFIREIVRYSGEHTTVDVHSGLLDEALQARFHSLSADAHRLLQLLATAGIPMKHATMAVAAGVEFDRYLRLMSELRAAHLVQISGADPDDTMTHDHDRIRETVSAHVEHRAEQTLHLQLARALEHTGAATRMPEITAHHLMVGGRPRDAAGYWLDAAEQAMDSLAFESAAARYRATLRCGAYEDDKREQLRLRLAEALVNSGRGFEAGEAYLEVADATEDRIVRMRCLYLAAEQLLISGHIDRGREVLNEVLETIDVRLPKSRFGTFWSLLWRRAWLRMRGYGWREHTPDDIAASDLLRVDIQRTTGRALGMVEPVAAAALQCRALLQALRVGEPVRVGWCLSFEAAFLSSADSSGIERGRHLLGKAEALATKSADPPLQAWVYCCGGILDCMAGHYRSADAALVEAERRFTSISGYAWEHNTVRVFRLLTLRFMGEFHEMRALRDKYLPDAIDHSDLYTETTLRRLSTIMWLASDDVAAARRDLKAALWNTSSLDLQLQDWYEMRARTEIALYERDSSASLEAALASLARVETSNLIRVQVTRIEQRFLRGRVLLALAPERMSEILRIARLLEGERCLSGDVAAAFLRAGLAVGPGDRETALQWLRKAETLASEAGAEWLRQISCYWQGQTIGEAEGKPLTESSLSWMQAHGIAAPDRMAAFLLPTAAPGLQR